MRSSISTLRFGARAPSNIALIKYMGKKEGASNLPENGSLSMTLTELCTFAEISLEESSASSFHWVAELPRLQAMKSAFEPRVPSLQPQGVAKVIRHLERVRGEIPRIFSDFGLTSRSGEFRINIRTANTFPQGSGIASSASSFAAMTLAAAFAFCSDPARFQDILEREPRIRRELAKISRMGSGSSCRSFDGPFVYWNEEETSPVSSLLNDFSHFVCVVSDQEKRVSSSQAHTMIKSSPLWKGRVERVERRLVELRAALEKSDLKSAAKITWSEAWEMHSLFHTSAEPFSYWEPGTMQALQFLAPFVQMENPPIVTLDAGPNVHLSVEKRFASEWKERLTRQFPGIRILEDRPGKGAISWLENES